MRPTTAPLARASKSSSFHWPDEREADARLSMSRVKSQNGPSTGRVLAGIFIGLPLLFAVQLLKCSARLFNAGKREAHRDECLPIIHRRNAYRVSIGLKPIPLFSGPIDCRDGTTSRPNYCSLTP
jgi:hypothetical protein